MGMETRITLRAQKSQRRRQSNLAMKFRRSVKGHFLGSTSRRNEQEATYKRKHGIRNAEGAERNSPELLR